GRTRWAELPDNLLPILEKYCNNLVNDYLIYSKKGVNMPIDPKSLREIFNFYLEKAELLIPNFQDCKGRTRYVYHFHTLRHTYASLLLERGFNFVQIRDALGHISTKTVEIYTHVTNLHEDINQAFFNNNKEKEKPVKENKIQKAQDNILPERNKNPIEILKVRLASGEINMQTYREYAKIMQ
ncbi:MAG: tyrosine-type recombinase/integrase, partial [Candidatus Woesearchaeota archaeon]|nr:tyrosine-type recombinase/integrase [Candidatus Woesearchaeota archaeon]